MTKYTIGYGSAAEYLFLSPVDKEKEYLIRETKKEEQKQLDILRDFNFLVEQYFRQKHQVTDYAELLYLTLSGLGVPVLTVASVALTTSPQVYLNI